MRYRSRVLAVILSILAVFTGCSKTEVPDFNRGGAVAIDTFCLQNSLITNFLDEVNYPSDDYSFSCVESYCKRSDFDSPRPDQPLGAAISWTPRPDAESYTIAIAQNAEFAHAWSYSAEGDSSNITIYNLIPGRRYYYKVNANLSSGISLKIKSGEFVTEGMVRMAKIDGIANVRDLGGWPSETFKRPGGKPKTIRYGRIYRGSEMNATYKISEEGIREMTEHLGISYDLDFRKTSEMDGLSGRSPLGNSVVFKNRSNSTYASIKSNADIKACARLMYDALKDGHGLYFHCVAGADRTGTMAFLFEGLLGVSEDNLAKEYELTSFSRDYKGALRIRTRTNQYHKYADMVNALKNNFTGATLQEKFNSWFLANGFTQSEIDWLIDNLLE